MLFLAVFCGFLAENEREHFVEHKREKQYMLSLTEDLKTDIIQLQTYINWRQLTKQDFDSVIALLPNSDLDVNAYHIYRLINRSALRFGLPDLSERTIQQLKNSGGLRLIRNEEVSDAINRHYLDINRMKASYETERLVRMELVERRADVLDAAVLSRINDDSINNLTFKFITRDPLVLNHFLNSILVARQINNQLLNLLDSTKNSSARLNDLIRREYRLKTETGDPKQETKN
jgi:hypothetical protein